MGEIHVLKLGSDIIDGLGDEILDFKASLKFRRGGWSSEVTVGVVFDSCHQIFEKGFVLDKTQQSLSAAACGDGSEIALFLWCVRWCIRIAHCTACLSRAVVIDAATRTFFVCGWQNRRSSWVEFTIVQVGFFHAKFFACAFVLDAKVTANSLEVKVTRRGRIGWAD